MYSIEGSEIDNETRFDGSELLNFDVLEGVECEVFSDSNGTVEVRAPRSIDNDYYWDLKLATFVFNNVSSARVVLFYKLIERFGSSEGAAKNLRLSLDSLESIRKGELSMSFEMMRKIVLDLNVDISSSLSCEGLDFEVGKKDVLIRFDVVKVGLVAKDYYDLPRRVQDIVWLMVNEILPLRKEMGKRVYAALNEKFGMTAQRHRVFDLKRIRTLSAGRVSLDSGYLDVFQNDEIDLCDGIDFDLWNVVLSFKRSKQELKYVLRAFGHIKKFQDKLRSRFLEFYPGMAQCEIGEEIGVAGATLSSFLSGSKNLTVGVLSKLLEDREIDMFEFFNFGIVEVDGDQEKISVKVPVELIKNDDDKIGGYDLQYLEKRLSRSNVSVFVKRAKLLIMAKYKIERTNVLAELIGVNKDYFSDLIRDNQMPIALFKKIDRVGVSIHDVLKGNRDLFGIPLENVEARLLKAQQSVGRKKKFVDNLLAELRRVGGSEDMSVSAMARMIGCAVSSLSYLIRSKENPDGYGMSLFFYLQIYYATGIRLSELLK